MKLKRSLTPIGILLAANAAFGWSELTIHEYPGGGSPWSASGNLNYQGTGNAFTAAKYSGSLKSLYYCNNSYETYTTPNEWQAGTIFGPTSMTLLTESNIWDPGCYSVGISEVWPAGDSNAIGQVLYGNEPGTTQDGAWVQAE